MDSVKFDKGENLGIHLTNIAHEHVMIVWVIVMTLNWAY